jgi:hypothetical protein
MTTSTTMAHAVEAGGKRLDTRYFFHTTCPRCARHSGNNCAVGVAKVH